jgi:mutator protein MutT
MTDLKHKQLVVSVGIIERDGKFLLTKRVSNHPIWHNRWEFPGGKIAPNETPAEALQREILEETSLQISQPNLIGVHTQHWDVPYGIQQTFVLLYHCHSLEGEVVLNPSEHNAFCWNTIEEIETKEDLLGGINAIVGGFFKTLKV